MSTTAKAPPTPPSFLRALLPLGALACLLPGVSPGAALVAGSAIGLLWGNPFKPVTRKIAQHSLKVAVVLLGAGVDLRVVLRAGVEGLGVTAASILGTLAVGTLLARAFRVDPRTGLLISVGTAVCGGSAIAAVAPTVRAKEHEITVSIATVFLLNGVALFVFPPIGRALGLSQETFGLWSALAIHDTSSVVGASMAYGEAALSIATTTKLARALWILPLTFAIGQYAARRPFADDASAKDAPGAAPKPWFIAGFLVVAALTTFVPLLAPLGPPATFLAKRLMAATLFLLGTSVSLEALKAVGIRPLAQGLVLWILVTAVSLGVLVAVR